MDLIKFSAQFQNSSIILNDRVSNNQSNSNVLYPSVRLPPVLGFGLPDKGEVVKLATLGINPSSKEHPNYISTSILPEEQWRNQSKYFNNPYDRWFGYATAVLGGLGQVSYGGIYRNTKNACHLDFSPFVTRYGMDSLYKNNSKPSWMEKFLVVDYEYVLVPLIEDLLRYHELEYLLIFGYVPGASRSKSQGNDLLKNTFYDKGIFHCQTLR
jgi:hypothetical protein